MNQSQFVLSFCNDVGKCGLISTIFLVLHLANYLGNGFGSDQGTLKSLVGCLINYCDYLLQCYGGSVYLTITLSLV